MTIVCLPWEYFKKQKRNSCEQMNNSIIRNDGTCFEGKEEEKTIIKGKGTRLPRVVMESHSEKATFQPRT